MNYKLLFLIGLFSMVSVCQNVYASDQVYFYCVSQVTIPEGYDIIELYGDLMRGSNLNAIEAGIGENDIYIHFNQNFETVSIYLYNDSGVLLYHNLVNTAIQQTVIIPINSAYNGSYYLEIDNATGYAGGDF